MHDGGEKLRNDSAGGLSSTLDYNLSMSYFVRRYVGENRLISKYFIWKSTGKLRSLLNRRFQSSQSRAVTSLIKGRKKS